MKNNNLRFAHIDSMRAIAALLVVWMHTSEVFVRIAQSSIQDELYSIACLLDFGRIGVVIFFAISGFLIPSSLQGDRVSDCRAFLIRRFFRLFPLYWLSIPFGFVTTWYLWGKDISISSILWNLTMFQEAAGHPSIQGLYWTLQTEVVFYGLCVFLFLLGWLRSPLVLLGLCFALTASYIGPPLLAGLGINLPLVPGAGLGIMGLNIGVMCWGALFRLWYDDKAMPLIAKVSLVSYVGALCALAAFAIAYNVRVRENLDIWYLYGPYAIGVSLFMVLALCRGLRAPWLVWLGTISYSIYLFHPVVMYSLSRLVQVGPVSFVKGWSTGSYMLVTVVGTIALSALTYRWVELPAIRFGHSLALRSSRSSLGRYEVYSR